MKKILKIILICSILFCSAGLYSIFSLNNSYAQTKNMTDDLSSFLEFEQKIIEINNSDTNQNIKPLKTYSIDYNTEEIKDVEEKRILNRLIVQGSLKDTCNAIDVVSFNNLHILCYSSLQETMDAYAQLIKDSSLNVSFDEIQTIEEYAEQDYDYTSYTNWGAESIDIGGYRQYLSDNNVTKEVVVVVLDTGINTSHPMFENRFLTDGNGKIKGFSYSDSTYRYSYNNLAFDVDDPTTSDINEEDATKYSFEDDHGHGAHVAGIICDLTPDNVKILPIKIGNTKGLSNSSIMISAFLRVINIYSKQYNIVSTNLSYSGAGKSSESERDTFNEQCYEPLMNLNILPITSAGNDYEEINLDGLKSVVVSSLKKVNNEYKFDDSYSNYGSFVDISAPGSYISSANISSTDSEDSTLTYKSGTSMATPQVVGVAALLCLNPNLSVDYTASDIEQMLYDNSLDFGARGKDIYYGHGILNLKYFEVENTETLSFYKNEELITEIVDNENFEDDFALKMTCSNLEFQIMYSTNKKFPTFSNHNTYNTPINITKSITLYVIGIKVENGEIVERTNLYKVSFFYALSPIEECFDIRESDGTLINYTGNFEKLTIPSVFKGITVQGIGHSLFKHANLEEITLPETVVDIAGYAFQYCRNLKYVYAPGVTKLYILAFGDCDSLTHVSSDLPESGENSGAYFPNLVETVGYSFYDCDNLQSVKLNSLIKFGSIEGCDFVSCDRLSSVELPLITSIPASSFKLCESLTGNFLINKNITSIGLEAFSGCNIESFSVETGNKYLYTDSIGLYTTNTLIAFAIGSDTEEYQILSRVRINNTNYTINTIEQSAAVGMEINKLIIPSTITTLNKFAFSDSKIGTLYYNATDCSHEGYWNKETYFRADIFNEIDTVEIGSNVTNIPERLFQCVDFNSLVINSYSTSFSSSCFLRGNNDVNKIYFNFTNTVSNEYLNKLFYTSGLLSGNIKLNYLYSKKEVAVEKYSKLNKLIYSTYEDGYFVYSVFPVGTTYKVSASSNGFGSISPSGETLISAGKSLKYYFYPYVGYYIDSIMVDGENLDVDELNDAIHYGYEFTIISSDHTIYVSFSPKTDTKYTIKHWQESLTKTGATLFGDKYYNLVITEISKGTTDTLTNATSKIYEGFTAQSITQQNISGRGSTIVDVLYDRNMYSVDIEIGEGVSSVSGKGNYFFGQTVILGAVLPVNYEWVIWESSDTSVIENSSNIKYLFTMPASSITFTAKAKVKEFEIGIDSNIYGNVNISNNGIIYYGDSVELEFVANEGCEITKVLLNNVDITDLIVDNKYIVSNITNDLNIVTTFSLIKYNISIETLRNDVTTNETLIVEHGSDKKYTFPQYKGFYLESVIIDDKTLSHDEVENVELYGYIFYNVVSNHVIYAEYSRFTYIISASSSENGEVSPTGDTGVLFNNHINYVFTPNTGYKIKDVKVDNVSVGPVKEYYFKNVDSAHSIYVEFEIIKFLINLNVQGNGSLLTDNKVGYVEYGGNIAFTVNIEDGWYLYRIVINDKKVKLNENNQLILENIYEDQNISVVFKKEKAKIFGIDYDIVIFVGVSILISVIVIIILINKSIKKKRFKDEMKKSLSQFNQSMYNSQNINQGYTQQGNYINPNNQYSQNYNQNNQNTMNYNQNTNYNENQTNNNIQNYSSFNSYNYNQSSNYMDTQNTNTQNNLNQTQNPSSSNIDSEDKN